MVSNEKFQVMVDVVAYNHTHKVLCSLIETCIEIKGSGKHVEILSKPSNGFGIAKLAQEARKVRMNAVLAEDALKWIR